MQDFQVIANTDVRLDVLKISSIHDPGGIFIVVIGVLLASLITFVRTRPPVSRWLRIPVGVAVLGLTIAISLFSHEAIFDRATATATFTDRWAGLTYGISTQPLGNLNRVVMESDGGQRRLRLLLNDGGTADLFGSAYDSEPNQYNIQDAINRFLGKA